MRAGSGRRREPHPGGCAEPDAEPDAEPGRSTFQPVSSGPRSVPRPGRVRRCGPPCVSSTASPSPRRSGSATYFGLAVAVRSLFVTGSSRKAGTLRSARQGREDEWLCLGGKRGARWARSRGALSARLPCPLSGHGEEDVSDRDGPVGRWLRAPVCRRSAFRAPGVYPGRCALWLRSHRGAGTAKLALFSRLPWLGNFAGLGEGGQRGVCDVGSAVALFHSRAGRLKKKKKESMVS